MTLFFQVAFQFADGRNAQVSLYSYEKIGLF